MCYIQQTLDSSGSIATPIATPRHRQAFEDLADGAFHHSSREFHPVGHEMLVRLAGDRIMARQFHVKHSPIRLTVRFLPHSSQAFPIPANAQGRSRSSSSCPGRAPPGGTTARASDAAMPRSMAGPL